MLIGFNLYYVPGVITERIKYTEFLNYVQEGYGEEVTIINSVEIRGEYSEKAIEDGIIERPAETENRWGVVEGPGSSFSTTMLEGDEIRALFDEYGVVYEDRKSVV